MSGGSVSAIDAGMTSLVTTRENWHGFNDLILLKDIVDYIRIFGVSGFCVVEAFSFYDDEAADHVDEYAGMLGGGGWVVRVK